MPKKLMFPKIVLVTLLFLLAPRLLTAQTPPTEQSTPLPVVSPQQTPTPNGRETAPAVYGLQGVLVETLDGRTVSAQAADQTFNPASSIKLATALVALRTFGPNYRFTTGFWIDGSFDKATGEIVGNLYVTGRDPSFHHEHA